MHCQLDELKSMCAIESVNVLRSILPLSVVASKGILAFASSDSSSLR